MAEPNSTRRVLARTAIVFAVLSFVPVWTNWFFSSWEAFGKPAPLWWMLESLIRATEQLAARELWAWYWPELVKTLAVLVVSFFVARWLVRR